MGWKQDPGGGAAGPGEEISNEGARPEACWSKVEVNLASSEDPLIPESLSEEFRGRQGPRTSTQTAAEMHFQKTSGSPMPACHSLLRVLHAAPEVAAGVSTHVATVPFIPSPRVITRLPVWCDENN